MNEVDDEPDSEFIQFLHDKTPIVLDDEGHRAGVANAVMKADTDPVRVVWWVHVCTLPNGKRREMLGHCDVHSGTRHRLESEDPLHVEPSILCLQCQDHGWIRNGKWQKA